MCAVIMDGKKLALKVKDNLKIKIADFEEKFNKKITLAVIMVGDNPASEVYVRNKIKATEYVGIKSMSFHLPEQSSENEIIELVKSLVDNKSVDGILVQLPLPKGIDEEKVLSYIPANKDVDGFSKDNVGNLLLGKETITACTPFGVMEILKEYNIDINSKNAVVIGRSNIVGKPMAMLLLQQNATVTMCHSRTKNLEYYTKNADIIVVAIGKPKFLKAEMVKDGAIIIDVGINRVEGKLMGDADYDNLVNKASYITPVPGGVGPMTIAMLLENTYILASRRLK